MPHKKVSSNAAEFCSDINVEGTAALYERMMRSSMLQFSDSESRALDEAGWQMIARDTVDDVVTAKREQGGKTQTIHKLGIISDPIFVVIGEDPSEIEASPSLDRFTMSKHVSEFIAAIQKENNGWGKTGPGGLMYRGFNIFEIYVRKEFNEMLTDVIRGDDDLCEKAGCQPCKDAFEAFRAAHEKCDTKDLMNAFEACCDKNRIKPEDITCQEVYLGYDPFADEFLSAWDVFGSESTGSVLLSFSVGPDGYPSEVRSINDASNRKFYEKAPEGRGPGSGRSLYDMMSGGRGINEGGSYRGVIDIRLD